MMYLWITTLKKMVYMNANEQTIVQLHN